MKINSLQQITEKDIRALIPGSSGLPAKFNEKAVRHALMELEAARNENWRVEENGRCVFVEMCVQEFKNLAWDTAKCIEKITGAKYKKQYGITKFSDFTDDEEGLINYTLIKYKAISLLEQKQFVDARQYNSLLAYYNKAKESIADAGAEDEARERAARLKTRAQLKKIAAKIFGGIISALHRENLLTKEVDRVIGEQKTGFIETLNKDN